MTPLSHQSARRAPVPWWVQLSFLALTCGALFYVVLLRLDPKSLLPDTVAARWFPAVPVLAGLDPIQQQALKMAAAAPLAEAGPRLQLEATPSGGRTLFYLATNLPDGARFELSFTPDPATLVGEPTDVPKAILIVQRHLAKCDAPPAPPGYYWVRVIAAPEQPAGARAALARLDSLPFARLFVGGSPDLGYRTRLQDFQMVRRGTAQAELDALKDVASRLGDLLDSEIHAQAGLARLSDERARRRAWEIFDPTWKRGHDDLVGAIPRSSRFFPKVLASFRELETRLVALHQSGHEIVSPPPMTPSGASPASVPDADDDSDALDPASVAKARALADAQTLSERDRSLLKDAQALLDSEARRLSSTPGYFEAEAR